MRIATLLLGILLVALGSAVSFGLIEYDSKSTLAKLGPLEVKTTQRNKVDPKIGYLLLGVGTVVVIVGAVMGKK